MESHVSFGSKWTRDGLGLKGNGRFRIDGDSITLEGRRHTAPLFKALLWLLTAMMTTNICFVVYSLMFPATEVNVMWVAIVSAIGLILVIAFATALTRYFGSSPYSTRFSKSSVTGLEIEGNVIRLKPSVNDKTCVFRTDTEQEAREIQINLRESSE
ncbi:MAG: hypothetical protein V1897_16375 [Pseudomonadota bacterium]